MTNEGRQREWVGLAAALAILTGVAWLGYSSTREAENAVAWVSHTGDVVRELEAVTSAYARATSARRAYAVLGDDAQLADCPELDAKVSASLTELRSSVADNPGQVARLETLESLFQRRTALLEAGVRQRRDEGRWAETPESFALTAKIRSTREELEQEENRLLRERSRRTRADIRRSQLIATAGMVSSFAILLFAFRLLRKEVSLRRSSEKFLDSVVENLPSMVFIKEARALRFARINRAGESLLGLTRAELLGKNDYDFFPEEQAAFFQKRDRDALAKGQVIDIVEEPIDTKMGTKWLHTKKVPILGADDETTFLLGISDDITERRAAALELREAKEAAEYANRELEAFSYSVAHDLRAPIRAIDGFSMAIEEDAEHVLDQTTKDNLKLVRACARQMSELIEALLGLASLASRDVRREQVDLTAIAESAAARLRQIHPGRDVAFKVEPGLVTSGDPTLLAAVFDNLLGNAWKFTSKREGAQVEVGSQVDGDRRVFFVRDNGAGFDPAYQKKLFVAFQRLHSAREFQGTGIGLATVQRIVRRHGGRIWAEGAVGKGATFWFTL